MECPFYEDIRKEMYEEIRRLQCDSIDTALNNAPECFHILLGKQPDGVEMENMVDLCLISGKYISRIYDSVTDR